MVIQVDNKELMDFFESWLDDFKRVSEGMLEKINVDRGATLKIPETDFRKLKMLTEALDSVAKKKFGFENVPDFSPMVASMKRLEACIEKIYIPEEIKVNMPNIEFPAIPAPEVDFTPLLKGIEDLSQLMKTGISASITNFDQMPLVFDKTVGGSGATAGGGDATEATLQSILSALNDVVTNTAAISIDADSVNLNTDTLETLIAAGNASLATVAGAVYTEGATDATITGFAMLFEGAADTLKVPSASNPLPVNFTNASLDVNLNAGTNNIGDVDVLTLPSLPAGTNAIGKLAANSGVVIGAVEIASAQTIAVTGTFWQATQPVSGTVTANLSATDNAVLDAIAASLAGTLTVTGGGGGVEYTEGDTDASITGSAIMWEDTSDTLRAVSAAKPLPVSVIAALPAGTNGIGKLTANAGVTIGAVEIASAQTIAVTNAGTFLVQNVGNVAHDLDGTASAPMLMGGYASAAAPTSVSADGDAVRAWYLRNGAQATVLTAAGALIGGDAANGIDVDVTRLPTLAAVTTVSTLTNITNWGNIVDNAGFTDGTTRLMMNGYIYDEVAGTALTENDGGAARMDAKRAQVMVIEDVSTRGTANRLAITTRLSLLAEGPTAADAAITASPITIGGRASAAAPTDMSGDGDVVNLWLTRKGAVVLDGGYAHDAVDAGGPVKVGMRALAHGTNPTAVAAADRTDWLANRAGIPWVMGGHPNIVTKQLNITDADGAQTDTALVTVAGGLKIVVTHISAMLDSATTATGGVAVRIGFGTTNTPAADAAGIILSHPGIAAGSGIVIGNGGGMIGVGGDGEDLRITCEDPAGGNLDIVVGYYTIES